MTSQESLGGSCSPPPNPPAPLASIQQEMKPNSSDSSIEQRHDAIVMEGSATPPTLPSISTFRIYVGTFTPSSTLSAIGTAAGSSGSSATLATTGTNGTTTTYTAATNNIYRRLSFDERIQVIQARSSGKSLRQLALQFGCGKTQILNILGQREAYLKAWENRMQAELLSNE